MPNERLVRKALCEQKRLVLEGRPCWLRNLRNSLKETVFGGEVWEKFVSLDEFKGPCHRLVKDENEDG